MSYSPSQALTELLSQHAALRELMNRCDQLADAFDAGALEAAPLLAEVAQLRVAFDTHNHFEEKFLRPVLRETVAFGDVRVEQMATDHIGEHRLIHEHLDTGVTGELRQTLARLRDHLATEERYFLTSKVLRDDLVVLESTG